MPIYATKDRSGRRRWRYEFDRVVDGSRRRATKLLPAAWTRAEAEAYGRRHDARLYAVATGAARHRPLISEAVALYLRERAPHLKNRRLGRELALCFEAYAGRHMDELAEVAREYARDHHELSPATIGNRMAYLRAACRYAWKRHALGEHDPAERMTLPPVRNERHVYIGRADMLVIARTMTNRAARAVVRVLFYSGMRLSEALGAIPTARGWLLPETKNGERRLVPIHHKVAHLAHTWPPAVAARTVQGQFSAAAKVNGYTDLRVHDLRHSAASAMVNAGVDLHTIGAVLGHKAAASTRRYSHLSVKSLGEAVGKIGRRA